MPEQEPRDRPELCEVEITEEMKRAGVRALIESGVAGDYEWMATDDVAVDVFRAMWAARPRRESA